MNFVSEYIKYLYNAKGRHGIHSPFVYDFTDRCLRLRPGPDLTAAVRSLGNTLAGDKTLVETEDAGAGSRRPSKARTVGSIYRIASSKGVYARLLWQLTAHYKPRKVLEMGTSLGIGTIHLASGNPDAEVISVDACANTLALARHNLDRMGIGNVTLINRTFTDFFAGLSHSDTGNKVSHPFDLVYIDGHHDGEALKKYLDLLKPYTHPDTLFVIDDIRWSDGMLSAWKDLSACEEYHLSMDLFRMGILAARPGQMKEHFVIRLHNVLSGF